MAPSRGKRVVEPAERPAETAEDRAEAAQVRAAQQREVAVAQWRHAGEDS